MRADNTEASQSSGCRAVLRLRATLEDSGYFRRPADTTGVCALKGFHMASVPLPGPLAGGWGASATELCHAFTACHTALVATAVHAAAPVLLLCTAVRFAKPLAGKLSGADTAPPSGRRGGVQAVLLTLCVLLDGTAAALPLLSHVVPGMITLTAQVSAVSGVASWSAACALMVVLYSAEHALEYRPAVVIWALTDASAGMLSIADAACGGMGSSGVLWTSAGAIIVVASVSVRLVLLLLLFLPRLGERRPAPSDGNDLDFPDDVSSSMAEEVPARQVPVAWGQSAPCPALGNALENSGWLAQLLMTWPGRVLSAGRVRPLFHGDMSEAPAETLPAVALDTFFLLWARRAREPLSPSSRSGSQASNGLGRLGWVLWHMNSVSWVMAAGLGLLAVVVRLSGLVLLCSLLAPSSAPLPPSAAVALLSRVVGQDSDWFVDWQRLAPSASLVLCLVMSAVFGVQGLFYLAVEHLRLRNLLWAVVYRSAATQPVFVCVCAVACDVGRSGVRPLGSHGAIASAARGAARTASLGQGLRSRLTALTQQAQTPGVSEQQFAAVLDIDSVCCGLDSCVGVIEAAVELLGGALVLALLVPFWGAAAAALVLAATAVRVWLVVARGMRPARWQNVMRRHSQRVAAADEMLDGILPLKYLGWEQAMAQRVLASRRLERHALSSLFRLDSLSDAVGEGAALLAAAVLGLALVDGPLPWPSVPSMPPLAASRFVTALAVLVLMWWRASSLPAHVWLAAKGRLALEGLDAMLQPRTTHSALARAPLLSTGSAQSAGPSSPGAAAGGRRDSVTMGQKTGDERPVMVQLQDVSVGWHLAPAACPQNGTDDAQQEPAKRQPRMWRVLEHVNLTVHAGDHVAVVGGPASGKSSLLMGLAGEASLLAAASPSLAAPAAFVARPICITTARPWVEEDLSIEMNVVGWQRTDTRVLSHTLDLCGLRPHGHAASSVSASDAPTRRVLDSASLAATWPDELRERVGLARSVYAAALACGASTANSNKTNCLVLLDEPLASVRPMRVRLQQLERILRSSLLANAAVVLTGRDSSISHIGVTKVVLLRSARAVTVAAPAAAASSSRAPPARTSVLFAGAGTADLRGGAAAAAAAAGAASSGGESPPSVWNLEGEHGQEDSYLLLQPTDESGASDDNADSPAPSTSSSPHKPRRVRAAGGQDAGASDGQAEHAFDHSAWGQWMMSDRRPHGAGGLCQCEWGCRGVDELLAAPRPQRSPRSPQPGVANEQAHAGHVLLHMLHGCVPSRGHDDDGDGLSPSAATSCLLLLHAVAAAACVCAPYALALALCEGGASTQAVVDQPDALDASLQDDAYHPTLDASSMTCPPWTPCSSNCSTRVADEWDALLAHARAGERSPFVRIYWGMLGCGAVSACIAAVGALGASLSCLVPALAVFRRRYGGPRCGGADDEKDVVSRVVLRASSAAGAALLRPAMLEKIKCALRVAEAAPSLDGSSSALPLSQPLGARQVLISVLVRMTYIVVTLSWLLVMWPALALPVAAAVLWLMQVSAQLWSSRIQLERFWRAPVCAQLDRLWLALRNGVEMRVSAGAKDVEEAALQKSLRLSAAAHATAVATHLLCSLRLDLVGISLSCLPMALTALSSFLLTHAAPWSSASSGARWSVAASQADPRGDVDVWVLAGLGVVQGLWCWAHAHALFVSFRCLAQAVASQWRLQMLGGKEVLNDENKYRARCAASTAEARRQKALDAILSALQARGLSETWRRHMSSSRRASSAPSAAREPLRGGPSGATAERSAPGEPLRGGHSQHELVLESLQLADGSLTLGGDGAYVACNGFTEPLRARVRTGGLLWVGGASVVRDHGHNDVGAGLSRHGLAGVLGGWGHVAAGRVLLGGDDVAHLPLSEVRRQIVVVPEEPLVVSGTVRQNLDLLGKAQGDWEIWAALEQCFFADTVRAWPGE